MTNPLVPLLNSSREIVEDIGTDGCAGAIVEDVGSKNEAWYKAIEQKDCKKLLETFEGIQKESNRWNLCVETGNENRTVLHVACM